MHQQWYMHELSLGGLGRCEGGSQVGGALGITLWWERMVQDMSTVPVGTRVTYELGARAAAVMNRDSALS